MKKFPAIDYGNLQQLNRNQTEVCQIIIVVIRFSRDESLNYNNL